MAAKDTFNRLSYNDDGGVDKPIRYGVQPFLTFIVFFLPPINIPNKITLKRYILWTTLQFALVNVTMLKGLIL